MSAGVNGYDDVLDPDVFPFQDLFREMAEHGILVMQGAVWLRRLCEILVPQKLKIVLS